MSLGWGTLTLLWTAMFTTLDVDIFRNENCFWYDINLSCFISSKEWKKQFLLIFRNNIYLLRSYYSNQTNVSINNIKRLRKVHFHWTYNLCFVFIILFPSSMRSALFPSSVLQYMLINANPFLQNTVPQYQSTFSLQGTWNNDKGIFSNNVFAESLPY